VQPTYTAAADAFREKIQAFLAEHLPADWEGIGALDHDESMAFTGQWRDILRDNRCWPRPGRWSTAGPG